MGGAPRRRRRAAFSRSSSFDLPHCFSSNQPVSLRGRAGGVGVLSGGVCASARGARSLSRGHGGSGECRELALFHVISGAALGQPQEKKGWMGGGTIAGERQRVPRTVGCPRLAKPQVSIRATANFDQQISRLGGRKF